MQQSSGSMYGMFSYEGVTTSKVQVKCTFHSKLQIYSYPVGISARQNRVLTTYYTHARDKNGTVKHTLLLIDLDSPEFESWQGYEIFLFTKTSQTGSGAHRNLRIFNGYHGWSPVVSGRRMKLLTYRLRMSEAMPLLPLYAFKARTGQTFTFHLFFL